MAGRLTLGSIVCMVLASCQLPLPSGSPYAVRPDVPQHIVAVPPGNFFGIAWLPDGTIVVGHTVDLHPWIGSTQGWQLRADGTGFSRVPLPNDSDCRVTEYRWPTALGDGRLGLTKRCNDPKAAAVPNTAQDYAVAYSLKTHTLEVLTPALNQYPGDISWDPTLQRAVASEDSSIVASIFAIDRRGTQMLHVPIRDSGRVFWLDDYFNSPPDNEAEEARQGRATAPEWSPDGRTIAFLAEARSIGVTGFARMHIPFDLYFMNPDGTHLRRVMPEVEAGPTWSPDSRYLALGHKSAVWIWKVGSKRAIRVASEALGPVAWSPDGRKLAAIRWLHNDDDQYEIVILDLEAVIDSGQ